MRQGSAAFYAGRPLTGNPHVGTYAQAWRAGWHAGERGALSNDTAPTPTRIISPHAKGRMLVRAWRHAR